MLGLKTTIFTGVGSWNPLLWIAAAVMMLALAYAIYARGNRTYKRGSGQTAPFLSGNPVGENDDELQVKSSNLYWGFRTALDSYYWRITRMHSGMVTDYFAWFVIALSIIFIIIFGGTMV